MIRYRCAKCGDFVEWADEWRAEDETVCGQCRKNNLLRSEKLRLQVEALRQTESLTHQLEEVRAEVRRVVGVVEALAREVFSSGEWNRSRR
jgi:DNA-directed RNA polymerase subunit RPC12/RpoP